MIEDIARATGIPYQVIGGPRFYERAEIKDAVAYLQVIDNPADAVSLARIANRPRRGIGDTTIARLQTFADAQGIPLWEALGRADEAGVGTAPRKAVAKLRAAARVAHGRRPGAHRPGAVEAVFDRSGYVEALEAERTVEAQGRLENLHGARRRRAGIPARRPMIRRFPSSFSRSPSTPTRTISRRRAGR